MLAQTTSAVAPSAHEQGGASAKKDRGIAGLFADILSQAQKNLGTKGGDPTKARMADATKPSERRTPHDPKAESLMPRERAKGGAGTGLDPLSETGDARAERRSRVDAATPRGPHAAEAQAPSMPARQIRGSARAEASDTDAGAAQVVQEKRRAKEKREIQSDETAAAAGVGSHARTLPGSAILPKPKSASSSIDADSSIDKKAERASSEPKITVTDLRRSSESRREAASKAGAKADESAKDGVREAKAPGADSGREVVRELSLDARRSGEAPARTEKADASPARAKDFQSVMAERMRDAWNGEIVQSAHIVLKDGDAGIIRLRLRPESLGNVKIELNLSENNISGRIIVESDEAKNAFERNMNELSDAFKQGGFDSARLEVSVGGGAGGGAQAGNAGAGSGGGPFFSERLRDAVGSTADPATAASAYARRGSAIDMLV